MSAWDPCRKPPPPPQSPPRPPTQRRSRRRPSFESAPLPHSCESPRPPPEPLLPTHSQIFRVRRAQTPPAPPGLHPPPHATATPPSIPPTMVPEPYQISPAPQSPRELIPSRKTLPQNPPPPSAPSAANQKSAFCPTSARRARLSANSTNLPESACQSPAALSKKAARKLRQLPPALSRTLDTVLRPSPKSVRSRPPSS